MVEAILRRTRGGPAQPGALRLFPRSAGFLAGIALRTLLFALLFLLAWASPAAAHPYVLRTGRETEILALFAPHALGAPVAGGFALWNVAIQQKRVEIELRTGSGATATVWLLHPDDPEASASPPGSKHFAGVIRSASTPEAQAAAAALLEAVRRNDQSSFWEAPRLKGQGLADASRPRALVAEWYQFDGLAVLAALALLSAMLAARHLAAGPRRHAALLLAITAAGLAVRLALAPESFLGAWPWSRVWPSVSSVAGGSILRWIAQRRGQFDLIDVISWTHLAYAALMPVALFAHGAFLLKDPRMGLVAAAAVAFLPQHIRFSRAEDAFIPSLVLTSLAFAAIHAWLRDESRVVRVLALLTMPLLLYVGYQLRPLNIAFTAVYLLAIATLHPEQAPRHRRWLASALVVAVALAILPGYIGNNDMTLRALLASPTWLLRIPLVLLWPPFFVLTDPRVTPPALAALALVGVGKLRGADDRRMALFLGSWLLLFVVLHSTVVQETMQPRYHMHLVVPFLLLAALSGVRLWDQQEKQAARRGKVALAVGASVVLAPLIHGSFIGDLGRAEQREHAFVLEARRLVPEGCTVLEYAPELPAIDLRFQRIGARVGGTPSQRFQARPLLEGDSAGLLEELSKEPPACLYYYEGLSCMLASSPDVCRALRERFDLETRLRVEVPADFYDRSSVHPARQGERVVPLSLSRARLSTERR